MTIPGLPHKTDVLVEVPMGDVTLVFESRYYVYRTGRILIPTATGLVLERWFAAYHGDRLFVKIYTQ